MRQSHQISQPKVVHAAGFLFLMETYQTTNAGRVVHADRSRAHVRQCRGGHDPHVEGRASSSRRARITATTSRRAATAADQDREKREPREPVPGSFSGIARTTRPVAAEIETDDQATIKGGAGMAAGITGQVFGRLTVVRRSDERNRDRDRLWLCRCQCGNETLVIARLLRSGATQSCGCLRRERAKNLHRLRSK